MKLSLLVFMALVISFGLGCPQGSNPPGAAAPADLETLRGALTERDEVERTYLLTSFLRTMTPENLDAAFALLEQYRAGVDKEEVRLFMLAWGRFDAAGAFQTARDWTTPWGKTLMEQAMYAWGYHDGPAALAECRKVEDEEYREKLRQELVSGWLSSNDRKGASEYAATVEAPKRRSRLALRLAGEAKRDGPDAIIAWAESIPIDAPNHFKPLVFNHAVGALTRLDPERAAAWYESHLKDDYSEGVLRNIASKWMKSHDPKALVAWIDGLHLPPEREGDRVEGIRAVFRAWPKLSVEDSEAWLQTAAKGPARDAAIEEFSKIISDTSPQEALEWAGRLTDDELRRRRTLRYTRRWYAVDPAAAEKWLETADIPALWRQQALNNLPHASRGQKAKNAKPAG